MEYLKSQLLQKERLVKQKDNQIFKLQVELSSGKKELSTSRAYIAKLEGDIKDLEHSMQIQNQKQQKEFKVEENFTNRNCTNGNTVSEYENIKNLLLEQRVRHLELELVKYDNKIDNLSDKLIDLKLEHGNGQRNRRTKKQYQDGFKTFDYNYKHLCTDDKNSDFNCELNNHISDFNILTNFRSDEIEDDENNGRNLKLDNDQEVEVNEIVTGNCITKGNDILNNNSTFFRERQSYEKASLYSDKEKTPRKNRSFLHFTEKEDGKTTSKTAESISRKTTQYEGKSSDETQSNDATAPCDISNRVPETVRVNIGKVNTDKFTILTFNFEGFMSSKLYFNLLTKRADIILLQEYWRHCRESKSIQENSENYICSIKSFDDDIIESPLERKRGHAGVPFVIVKH